MFKKTVVVYVIYLSPLCFYYSHCETFYVTQVHVTGPSFFYPCCFLRLSLSTHYHFRLYKPIQQ